MLDRTFVPSGSTSNTNTGQLQDPVLRRRLFAGFRPLSGFGLLRMRSAQHRSISLPESNDLNYILDFFNLILLFFLFYSKINFFEEKFPLIFLLSITCFVRF